MALEGRSVPFKKSVRSCTFASRWAITGARRSLNFLKVKMRGHDRGLAHQQAKAAHKWGDLKKCADQANKALMHMKQRELHTLIAQLKARAEMHPAPKKTPSNIFTVFLRRPVCPY
ncbi:hypothetical protein ACQKEN_10085 [Pseudomonas sp. NPDC078416]|uniref:hypothetical protein n=1 Tax=Pseudomonas sp. NPDC078416 TaxID=3390637 RepID=UPI003CFF23A6